MKKEVDEYDVWRDVDSDDDEPSKPRKVSKPMSSVKSTSKQGPNLVSSTIYAMFFMVLTVYALCKSPIKLPQEFESIMIRPISGIQSLTEFVSKHEVPYSMYWPQGNTTNRPTGDRASAPTGGYDEDGVYDDAGELFSMKVEKRVTQKFGLKMRRPSCVRKNSCPAELLQCLDKAEV